MRTNRTWSRRAILKSIAASAPMIVPARVLGLDGATPPSEKIVLGCIGIGPRMHHLLPNFLWFEDVQCVAVADAMEDRLREGKARVDQHYGTSDCRAYSDFRELLARPEIDAVVIATGERWHAWATMWAARAGKDVYCEKPISLTIGEARRMVETCRALGTVYQGGMQRRSVPSYRFARELVRRGCLGRVRRVEAQVWEGSAVPHAAPEPVPPGFDYDMWLGPVAWRPYVRARVAGWIWFWDTGEGIHSGMGVHYTDLMQWTLDRDDTLPVEYEATDLVWPDPKRFMSDLPLRGTFRCRYADGVECVLYQRGTFAERYIRFVGEHGWVQVDDHTDQVTAEPASLLNLRPSRSGGWQNAGDHARDFLDAVRTRQRTLCHPEAAFRSQFICHAWSISARLGRRLVWDPIHERFDCEEANRMMYRTPRSPWAV